MRIFITILSLMVICLNAGAAIQLTQEQFENMDVIHAKLKASDTNFVGLNGSKDAMKVIGVSDTQAMAIINKIDFDKEKTDKEKPSKDKKNRIQSDLEKLNISQETVEYLLGGV